MHRQFHDLGKLLGLRSVCVHSGVAKDTQYAEPAVGCDVCVGTPGRLQQFVTARQLKLLPCMILVVDGADRMLSMGLEHELTQIAHKIRPDHQTVMWVTSWLKGPQRLVDYMLENYVQVNFSSAQPHVVGVSRACTSSSRPRKSTCSPSSSRTCSGTRSEGLW
ncbi:hypothetical protein MRX96_027502 [Rhipicephalus microplus]